MICFYFFFKAPIPLGFCVPAHSTPWRTQNIIDLFPSLSFFLPQASFKAPVQLRVEKDNPN
jgi:hypothetical protein